MRDVVLMPALGWQLRERRASAFATGPAKPEAFVYASSVGTGLHYRNVARRGLDPAMREAKLDGDGRPRLRGHNLHHTFASLSIASGANVVYVSKQLGHSSPLATLAVYSHPFDREHARRTGEALEAVVAPMMEARPSKGPKGHWRTSRGIGENQWQGRRGEDVRWQSCA